MTDESRTLNASSPMEDVGPEGEAANTRAPRIKPGDVLLGKYRVERELGQGGMGVVLAVRHMELDDLFAMKILLPGALKSSEAVDRFLREARASARLKSEHIARVFDVGRLDGDRPYMVMEYLHGQDLKDLLRKRGPLPIKEAVDYMLQVCDVVAAAHDQGIVHRDIKPSNLFLTPRSKGGSCVKVIDFGISKVIAPDGTDLTKSGAVLGTPYYMSPEQMMHSKDVGPQTDVWSLGVVLYELITNELPFTGETLPQIVSRVLNHHPEPPSRVRPGLPSWLDAVVMRCLQKAPDERFQGANNLAAALRSRGSEVEGAKPRVALDATVPGTASSRLDAPYAARTERTVLSLWQRDVMVMIHSKVTPTEEDWVAHLDRLRAWLDHARAPTLIVLSSGGGPTSAQRKRLVSVVETVMIRVALLSDSAVLRGINTAIGWFLRSKLLKSFTPTQVDEAVRYLDLSPEATQDAAEMVAEIARREPSLSSPYVSQIEEQLRELGGRERRRA